MRRLTALAAILLLLGVRVAADTDAARYFVERGKKALEEKKHDDAEKLFEKAIAEETDFPPALFGLAQVAHARGDKNLTAGRLEACLEACGRAARTRECDEIREAAEKLLYRIDRPRLEYRSAVESYTRALMSLARRSVKSSPDLARRCVERILKVCPDHAEAREMQAKLGVTSAAKLPADANALFNGTDLTGWAADPPTWTVKDGVLVGHDPEFASVARTRKSETGDYTLLFEFRITNDLGEAPLVSLIFGMRALYDRWNLSVFKSKFRLAHYPGDPDKMEKLDEVLAYQLPGGFDRTSWCAYKIVVKDDTATFYANEHKLFERQGRPGTFEGFVGLVVQECTAEFRKIAVIR